MRLTIWAAALVTALFVCAQPASRARVGPLGDGGALLPNGWRLRPAGRQVPVDTFPMAQVATADGRYLLVLNAGKAPPSISVLDIAAMKEISRTPVPDAWLGLALAPKGDLVYVGGGAQASIFEFSFSAGKLEPRRAFSLAEEPKRSDRSFVGDIAFSPDGRLLYAAELYQNSIAVVNPQSGRVIDRFKTGRRPYRILFHPDGKTFFVSCWADGMVLRHETDGGKIAGKFLLSPHPTDMLWIAGRAQPALEEESNPYVARIFIAAAGTNSLRVLGVTDTGDIRPSEVINLGMSPLQPAGLTPSALGYDRERKRIYVACSDENAVAVVDISEPQSRVLGYVPTGRYPTAVRSLADGRMVVLNGQGEPAGSASFVDPVNSEALDSLTKIVLDNSPYRDSKLEDAGTPEGNPIPSWPGDPTPLRHAVYIVVDQGFTYDETLGDIKEGDGVGALARYGETVTPNLHKLAREFVLIDNFYVNGDDPADGYNWSVAALSPDYVEKLRPAFAARRRNRYDFEEGEPAAVPPAGYLWTNARTAGVPMATYLASQQGKEAYVAFLADLTTLEKSGALPRLIVLRIPSGDPAKNDRTLGTLVSRLTRSRFWPEMAIFVLVTNTGGGRDHVDRHRAPSFVISPYVRRRTVDSNIYNTTSMLRTVELISGLQPMTQFDAASHPMWPCFQPIPDAAPFTEATGGR